MGFDLIKNNKSDYSILLPAEPNAFMRFAAEELQQMVYSACKAKLPIATEPFSGGRVISLFETEQAKAAKPLLCDVGEGGYRIHSTAAGDILILGKSELATLYGVYGFLNRVFGVEIYCKDEIKAPKQSNVTITSLDISDSPDIVNRHVGFYRALDPVAGNRMRLLCNGMSFASENGKPFQDIFHGVWGGLWAHTMMEKILPVQRDESGEPLHREWYNDSLDQLCLTNEEMTKQFVENLKRFILERPNAKYFMLGIMDTGTKCNCPNCQKSDEKYGGASGTHILFINKVAKQIEAWRKEALPSASFKLVAFAYNEYKNAPVTSVNQGGESLFKPISPELVLGDNVAIMIAPLDICGRHSIHAPCNRKVKERFLGFSAICKHLLVWDYHAYFDDYMLAFPESAECMAESIRFYKQLGVEYVYSEGNLYDYSPGFHDLKIYLLSKLLWNCNQSTEPLVNEFFKSYYKPASDIMLEYYQLLEGNILRLESEYQALGARGYHTAFETGWQPDVKSERHWQRDFLQRAETLLQNAINVTCKTDVESRQRVLLRIKREMLMIKYLFIEMHTLYCSEAEFNALMNEFQTLMCECGVVRRRHGWFAQSEQQRTPLRREDEMHCLFKQEWASIYQRSLESKMLEWMCRYPARADRKG